MDTKNGTGGIARNISATLQSLQTENEQLRAGYDAARQEIASLRAQPYDQHAMGLCHVCSWKGVIDYPDGPVCVACEHDKTLSPQPTAQAQEDAEACADTRRLNFLESRGCDGWIARMSTTGRGYRLHQSHGNPFATARDAIDAAIAAQQGDVA